MRDWTPLDWYEDPVPGKPYKIRNGAEHMATVATAITEAAENLRTIASAEGQVSLAVDAFRERALDVASEIELVHERYKGAADALDGYVEPLTAARTLAAEALSDAIAARAQISSAQTDIANAENALWGAEDDDARQTANDNLSDAYTAQNNGYSALEDAKEKLGTAMTNRDEAAESAMGMIDEALEANGLDDSGWRQFLNKNADILDAIATALAVIGAVVAIVSIFIPGVNLIVLGIAVGVGAAAINFALAENGNKGWADFAMDMVGLATLGVGKVVTTAMRGARASRTAQVAANRSSVLAPGRAVPRGRRMPHGRPRPNGRARNRANRRRTAEGQRRQQAEYNAHMQAPSQSLLSPRSMIDAARHNINRNGWSNVLTAGGGDAYQMSYYNSLRVAGEGGGQSAEALVRMGQVEGAISNASTVQSAYGATGLPDPAATWLGEGMDWVVPDQAFQDDVTRSR